MSRINVGDMVLYLPTMIAGDQMTVEEVAMYERAGPMFKMDMLCLPPGTIEHWIPVSDCLRLVLSARVPLMCPGCVCTQLRHHSKPFHFAVMRDGRMVNFETKPISQLWCDNCGNLILDELGVQAIREVLAEDQMKLATNDGFC